MRAARTAAAALLLGAAAAAVTGTIQETEPDGFTTPAPQPVGSLGAGGISIAGTLDPTSPTGLDPGDRDGFSFTVAADGPFTALVDDGAGGTFVLALSEETANGLLFRGAVLGPAPLVFSHPDLKAGTVYRVGVATFGDGTPRPYTLDLSAADSVPPWTGESCSGTTPEAEPDESVADATYLGWFDRTLCAEGDIAVVSPPDSGIDGDVDTFRFRNVLPVPARLTITADPGLVDLEVDALAFVGPAVVAQVSFGEETVLDLPRLEPGADYMIKLSAREGTAPVHYSFHLEPVAPPPPPPAEPLTLERAMLHLGPDAHRSRFSLRGTFEAGLGADLGTGTSARLFVRGGEVDLASGKLVGDAKGRLRWKAPPGLEGIQSMSFDPFLGLLVVRGRDIDLASGATKGDPNVPVELRLDDLRIAGSAVGKFRQKGKVLRVR